MGAEFLRELPVVVDEQLRAGGAAVGDRLPHLLAQHRVPGRIGAGRRLDAQLHRAHAGREHLAQPLAPSTMA
jgi:hypothetical protein